MSLWLYLHFPCLQLDAIYKQDSELMAPLVIVDEKNYQVLQLNSLAKYEGIKIGMGLGTAASLCCDLQVKPYQQSIEEKELKRIAHWLYPVTADIALFPPDGLLLRVSNMLTLYQDLACYWQALSQHLNDLAINYHYALGYSPYAARILAQQKLNQISDDKHWLLRQVKQQCLSNSDLEAKAIARLQKVGVHKLGDLLTLSLPELSKRFDVELADYIGRLTGHIQHMVDFYIPPEHFEQYIELYYEVSNHLYLEKPLLKLYRLLESYLKLKDKLAAELNITLHQRDIDDTELPIVAAQGEYKADKWWQLTKLKIASVELAAPIIGLTVKVKRLVNKYAQRSDLFQGSQGHMSAEELSSILMAKLGEDRVKGLKVVPDDRPEIANQLSPPFIEQAELTIEHKLRPSLLLPQPLPLKERVTVMPYPERVVAGWWDNNNVVRDYFIARSHTGRWLWLFRDNQQQWFVHGVFS